MGHHENHLILLKFSWLPVLQSLFHYKKTPERKQNISLFHHCNTKEPVIEVSLCANKPTDSYNLCCLGAGFGSLEQGWDALRLSRLKVTTVCWITRFLQKSLKTTLILKNCTWLRHNWDTLTEDTQWAMRVLHKTSQSHQIPILRDPMVAGAIQEGKRLFTGRNVPSSVHFPKYCAGLCLQRHQPFFTLNIRVKKVRKRNYRKHSFSKKEVYSFEIGKFRCPASMDSSKNKNPLLVSSLYKVIFLIWSTCSHYIAELFVI